MKNKSEIKLKVKKLNPFRPHLVVPMTEFSETSNLKLNKNMYCCVIKYG